MCPVQYPFGITQKGRLYPLGLISFCEKASISISGTKFSSFRLQGADLGHF